MTIHSAHPFATPGPDRDPVRRLRGRIADAVTLWTAGEGRDRVGLTVSSMMLAMGEEPRALALLDPDSDLAEALLEAGTAVVHVLGWEHRDLAGMFAGTDPAPGGAFGFGEFADTAWGPRLAGVDAAGVRLEGSRPLGWSVEVTCLVEEAWPAEEPPPPLLHHRGRYRRLET